MFKHKEHGGQMTSEKNVSSKRGRPLKTPTTDLGRFIRTKRIECGFTQTELAALSKISAPHVSMIESGTRHFVSAIVTNALAIVLKCTVEEIVRCFPPKKQATYVHPLGRFIHARCLELNYTLADIVRKSNLTASIVDRLMHAQTIRRSVIKSLAVVLACEESELAQFVQQRAVTISNSAVGKLLQDKRQKLNLTLAEVGIAVGVTGERIRKIEKTGKIPLIRQVRFMEVLHIDPTEFPSMKYRRKKHERREVLAYKCMFIGTDLQNLVKLGWTIEATNPDGKKYNIKIL